MFMNAFDLNDEPQKCPSLRMVHILEQTIITLKLLVPQNDFCGL